MKAYFDSSAVLSFLLGEAEGEVAQQIWAGCETRVSSILLQAECLTNLRKGSMGRRKEAAADWLADRLSALSACMREATLKELDGSILEVLRREDALSDCRTLDAIHLATALFFREKADGNLAVVSFDERMRRTAVRLGLGVLPAPE